MPSLEEVKDQIGHLDGASKLFGKREINELPNILWEDEKVEKLVQGAYDNNMGVLVATNKRLIFVDKGLLRLRVEDFPYGNISSIQYKTGVVMGSLTIFASGNKAEIKHVEKGQTRAFGDYVRARVTSATAHASAPAAEPTTSATGSGGDLIGQLERLGQLREQGILSNDEFEAQKVKLLQS